MSGNLRARLNVKLLAVVGECVESFGGDEGVDDAEEAVAVCLVEF
jgi:hypothetical protein